MIHFLRGSDFFRFPRLTTTMFQDRKAQFFDILKWPVQIDQFSIEGDQYDYSNTLYAILEDQEGRHAGSMRLMPVTAPTIINSHFVDALGGGINFDHRTWKCTRVCFSRGAHRDTSIRLLASVGYLLREFGIQELVAIFDKRTRRQYSLSGVELEIIGQSNSPERKLFLGRWVLNGTILLDLISRSGIDEISMHIAMVNAPFYREK